MPTLINPLITDAGLNAAIAASGGGLQLAITHIALGDGQYNPTIGMTNMVNRKEKVAIASGYVSGSGGFRVNSLFPAWAGTPNPYNATEIGFWAGDPDAGGVLFAVYSHTSSVIVARNSLDYVVQFSMQLTRVPTGSVTVTVDPAASQALALLAAHEALADSHVAYASRAQSFNLMTLAGVAPDFTTAGKTSQAIKRLAGANVRTVTAAGPTALTADDAGMVILDATSNAVAITLPAVNAVTGVPLMFEFVRIDGTANAVTVSRAGADTFVGGATSFTLVGQGDQRTIGGDATSKWATTAIANAGASLAANGWQKLPSGHIVQWGSATTNGSGIASFTFPIALTTTHNVQVSQGSGNYSISLGWGASSATANNYVCNTGAEAGAGLVNWFFVVGK